MIKRSTITLLALLMLCSGTSLYAQVYANKVVGKSNKSVVDSLEQTSYPYLLPIWGEEVTKKGFQLPYSAGLSAQYVYQQSDITITDLSVGFNHNPMVSMSNVIRFNNAQATTNGVNIRPDIWLLPFLNVYGLFAQSKSSTAIDAGLWIPDTAGNWSEISGLSTKAEFNGTTVGFGITPTVGVGGGWMALDMNFTWTDIEELDAPAYIFVFGPRFGKTFKLNDDEMNIALWVGGFRVQMATSTSGSINLNELFDTEELQTNVDNGLVKVEEAQQQVDTWWNGLSQVEQKNPVNKAKYETANRAIDAAGSFLNSADEALNDDQNASVQYSLSKTPTQKWNFIVGSQFQIDRNWMIRAEAGFLGARTQFIGGLQYRFGL
jgi:hypothetical protein